MTEVCVAVFAPYLGPYREPAPVLFLHDIARLEGFGEARPSRAGIVFVQGTEQGLAGDDIDIDARFLVVPVFIMEGWLRAVLLCYLELCGSQLFFQFLSGRFHIGAHISTLRLPGMHRLLLSPDLSQILVAP